MVDRKLQSFINDDERKGVLYGSLIAAGINAARGHNIGDALIRGISSMGQSYMQGIDTLYKEKQTALEQARLAEMMEMEKGKFRMLQEQLGMKKEQHKREGELFEIEKEKHIRELEKQRRMNELLTAAIADIPTAGLTPLQKLEAQIAIGLGKKPDISPTPNRWVFNTKTGTFALMPEDKIVGSDFVPLEAWAKKLEINRDSRREAVADKKLQALLEKDLYNQALKQWKTIKENLSGYRDMGGGLYKHVTNSDIITAEAYNKEQARLRELEAFMDAYSKKYGANILKTAVQPTANRDVTPLINYFLENKEKFPINTLVQAVRKEKRWSEDEINEALSRLSSSEQEAYIRELKKRGLIK